MATNAELRRAAAWGRRCLAERSLHEFIQQAWPVVEPEVPFRDNWHIRAVCAHLEAVADGRVSQLLINVPPGTMKSMLVSVFWASWVWTTQPHKRFMFTSYAESLAMRDSTRTRTLLGSDWYRRNWGEEARAEWGALLPASFRPVALRDDQNTKGNYQTTYGGWRMVASITGRGIGEHPDFNVFDDPHNVLQAESELERAAVVNWTDAVFCVRGQVRGCRRVGVMQRLHALDASGHLLKKGGWEHLCLPMRYEAPALDEATGKYRPRMERTSIGFQDPRLLDGELLWPEVYDETKVRNMEVNMGTYHAAGQLQQRPSPRGGGKFKREWFKILEACPVLVRKVRYWDKAGTPGGKGAQTSGTLMGTYRDDSVALASMRTKYIVLDVVTGRWQAAEREAVILQTAAADRATWGHVETWVEQEPGSGGKESAEGTVGNLAGFTCFKEKVTGDKTVRADPLCAQASVGKVRLLAGKWNSGYLDELEQFPAGALKDQVDSSSGAFNKLHVQRGFSTAADVHTGAPKDDGEGFVADRLRKEDF